MQERTVKEKEEEALDVKVFEEDRGLIEYRLMDVNRKEAVYGMIKKCAEESGFNKFLLILNKKEKRICYFDARINMDRIVINLSYFPEDKKSQESLYLAGKMARSFSGTAV